MFFDLSIYWKMELSVYFFLDLRVFLAWTSDNMTTLFAVRETLDVRYIFLPELAGCRGILQAVGK